MIKSTIALMLEKTARTKPLGYLTDKYIQSLYLLQSIGLDVVKSTKLNEDELKILNKVNEEYLTPPNYAYRLLEINNYVYLETKKQWVKVTEPTQLELELK